MKASQPVSIVQPLFQKNGLVAEKQHLFSEKKPCSQRNGPKDPQPFSANTVRSQNQTKVPNEYSHTGQSWKEKNL